MALVGLRYLKYIKYLENLKVEAARRYIEHLGQSLSRSLKVPHHERKNYPIVHSDAI